MSTLHTINKSPFEKGSLDSCLKYVKEGSAILFYEDGVYAALKGTAVADRVRGASGIRMFVLGADLKARGFSEDQVLDGIGVVDYAGFVDLSVEHDRVQAWV